MFKEVQEKNNCVYVYGVRDFALKDIFECGQCFRWNRQEDGSYFGVAFRKAVSVFYEAEEAQAGETLGVLVIKNCNEADFQKIWKKYFDLERDYGKIKSVLAKNDEIMQTAVRFGSGIRLLNQDEWETLISFILSQNRNIPLIKKSIEELSRKFGQAITDADGNTCYAFPTPQALAALSEEDLAECRLGYRARYVLETARVIAAEPDKLYEMTQLSYEEAFDYLKNLCGVGPKVANCILLFSMEKYASFPIDVWVRRLMSVLYGTDENNLKEIREYAEERFGELGGFAQQYLFYYARECGIGKEKTK